MIEERNKFVIVIVAQPKSIKVSKKKKAFLAFIIIATRKSSWTQFV